MMPIRLHLKFRFKYVGGLFGAERFEPGREFRILQSENRDGDQRRILRTVDRVVATGTPAGICTIDNSESSPFSARLDRNAHHGSVVIEATMPADAPRRPHRR